jgi:alkane 1-monooxygenase
MAVYHISPPRQRLLALGNVSFIVVYAIPALLMGSVWLGRTTGYVNLWSWAPLLIAYGLVPLLQALWPRPVPLLPDAVGDSPPWRLYHRLLLWLSLPAQLAMLYLATDHWQAAALHGWGYAGHLLSTGIFSGMFAINLSHELIHRRQHLERGLGGVLLSTVGFGTFKVVHMQIHHRYVGTPLDFATARRGQSIYAFWRQCFRGNVREAVRCERQRCARTGQPLWRSELVLWYGLSGGWLALVLARWGWMGGGFFLAQSLLAIMKLDCINYLQHYGLTRRRDSTGRFEPVQEHHAWSQGLYLHDLFLLNLLRHGDHHAHPQRPYQLLRTYQDAPCYPYNYALMILLSFVPRLFRHVVHPVLDRFAAPTSQA